MTIGGITSEAFRSRVAGGFRRRTPESPLTWLPKYVRYPDGWESTNFDFDLFPHIRGYIERFILDPTKRKATKCWSVRTGKTTTDEGLLQWKADQDPCPMVVLFPDNGSLDDVDNHLYPIMELCKPIAEQLPPQHERNRRSIRLKDCTIRLASGGKKSSVSGYPAQWVFKFEVDKLTTRKSSEADPSKRVDSRTSGFSEGVKISEEGSPCEKYKSRQYKMLTSPDVQQVRYYVPCPHCGEYQILNHENLEWQKNEINKSEPRLAEKTAWYRCDVNGCRIEDHHRVAMMQAGQWLIEGESIDKRGRVTGTPKVDSSDMCFWLSKLYSLLIPSWGSIASELVSARHAFALGDEEPLKKLYMEGFAIPWDPKRKTVRTNELAQNLRADDHPERGIIPAWVSFLTLAADVGMISEELIFYWMVCAWGGNCRGGVIDWGITNGKKPFVDQWKAQQYPTASGELVNLWGHPSGIDANTFTQEMYALCATIKNCLPIRGDSKQHGLDLYWPGYQRANVTARELENKRKANSYDLLNISSSLTQQWRVALTSGRIAATDPGFVSLPADVCDSWEDYEDFLSELTADQFIDGSWQGEDNEFGDTLRVSRALAQCFTRNGKRWGQLQPITASAGNGSRLFSRTPAKPGDRPFVDGFR